MTVLSNLDRGQIDGLWNRANNYLANFEKVSLPLGGFTLADCNELFLLIKDHCYAKEFTNIQIVEVGCFTADTEIKLLDGRILTLKEISKQYAKGGIYVYSYDIENRRIVPGKVVWAGRTKLKSKVIQITLDNGKIIKCTPDHKFLLRDGIYKEAIKLTSEDSLMPLNYYFNKEGYEVLNLNNGQEMLTHKWVANFFKFKINKNQVIHHDIFNSRNPNPKKTNNDPNFLKIMDKKTHFILHAKKFKQLLKMRPELKQIFKLNGTKQLIKYNKSTEGRLKSSKNIEKINENPTLKMINARKNNFINLLTYRKSTKHKNFATKLITKYNQTAQVERCHKIISLLNSGNFSLSKENWEKCRLKNYPRYETALSKGLINHRIKDITVLKNEDVYDLTVDKYHNFALNSGVFVHNCWTGVSTMILALLAEKFKGKVHAIDWFRGSEKTNLDFAGRYFNVRKIFEENVGQFSQSRFINLIEAKSLDAAGSFEDASLDVVFLDGDHRYDFIRADIEAWLPKLKPNGIMCGHDCEIILKNGIDTLQEIYKDVDMIQVVHFGVCQAVTELGGKKYRELNPNIPIESTQSGIWYYVKDK